MKDKVYDPATVNKKSPAEGMASVNTFTTEERNGNEMPQKKIEKETEQQKKQKDNSSRHSVGAG